MTSFMKAFVRFGLVHRAKDLVRSLGEKLHFKPFKSTSMNVSEMLAIVITRWSNAGPKVDPRRSQFVLGHSGEKRGTLVKY
jgi:hypothetical protein